MKLVTLDRPPHGRAGVHIGTEILDIGQGGDIVALARWAPADLAAVIAAGEEGLELLRRLVDGVLDASDAMRAGLRERGALVACREARLRAPIPRPGIVLSHGRAYRKHVQEMKPGEKNAEQPIGFMKNVNAIVGHGNPIVLPPSAAAMVDFEAEIAVVFSRRCHQVTVADAMSHVLGFTIVNDVSARDWVPEMAKNPDLNRMGKQFETFCPMGPCIATLDEMPDLANIRLVTRLNGAVMQEASTQDLIWSVPELIAYYSRWYSFQAGDVMTTGTPEGVGYGRTPKLFMKAGDIVTITVDGIGELSNPVLDAETAIPMTKRVVNNVR